MDQQLLFPDPVPVTLTIGWSELLGNRAATMPEAERRQRWATWLRLIRKSDRYGADYWRDRSECVGCIHLRGAWCKLQGLPCTVNPILTMRGGSIGMACCGAGYDDGLPPMHGCASNDECSF